MARLSNQTITLAEKLRKELSSLYLKLGAPGNVNFVQTASLDSLIYVLLLEAGDNIKRKH